MTAGRPGHDAGPEGPDAHGAYGADGAFVAAVDGLADPLNDPLPGGHTSPWFRSDTVPAAEPAAPSSYVDGYAAHQGPQQPQGAPNEWYDPAGYQRDWYGPQEPSARIAPAAPATQAGEWAPAPGPAPAPGLPAEPRTEVIGVVGTAGAAGGEPAEPRTEVIARVPADPEPAPDPAASPAPAPAL
ncbi:class E sortase, partial [Streptomyces sp. NPDC055886]